MRALLAVGGLLAVIGLGLMIVGVQQQISFAGCDRGCVQPSSLPVTGGILLLIGGAFVIVWGLAASHAARVLHPAPDQLVERRRLRQVGLRGRARALTWTESGTSPTGEPLLDVDLSIELPGRPPYRAHHRIAVARRHLSRLRSGRPLPVLVDPADPGRLVVDWRTLQRRQSGSGPAAEPPEEQTKPSDTPEADR